MLLKGAESAQVLTKPRPIDNNWPSLCSFCCCGHVPSRLSPGLIVLKTAEWLQTRKMAPLASTGSALRDSAEKGSLQLLEDSIADEHVLLGGGMHLYGSIGLLSLVKLLRIGSGCSRPKKIHKAIAMARGTTVDLVGPQSTRRGLASCGVDGHRTGDAQGKWQIRALQIGCPAPVSWAWPSFYQQIFNWHAMRGLTSTSQ